MIFYYSTTLWQAVGFSESDSFVISVITSVTNVAVTVIAILLVDKIGRRILLLVGSVGMALSLGAMTLAFTQAVMTTASDGTQTPQLGAPWSGIALVGANLFVVSFGATWGPVVWVLLGEMFPNRIRGAALSVAAAAQWLTNFLITTTFPPLSSISLVLAYGLYTGFAVLSFFFVLWKVQETKGIELEDMTRRRPQPQGRCGADLAPIAALAATARRQREHGRQQAQRAHGQRRGSGADGGGQLPGGERPQRDGADVELVVDPEHPGQHVLRRLRAAAR